MTSAPPPSGYPPGWQQPPRKYRPSAWWFALGGALIVAAGVLAVAMVVWLLVAFFDSDASVRADGAPHQVSVGTDGDRMLWLDDDDTTCEIVDRATGETITLRTVSGDFERSDSNGDLEGLYRFDPGSGDLEITCVQAVQEFGDDRVLITPMPEIENVALAILLAVVIPGLLGLAGVIALIVTTILFVTRDPRPKTT